MRHRNLYSICMDKHGNIKIPKEVRERFSLRGTVKLIIRGDGILIPCSEDKGEKNAFEWEYTQEPRLKSAYLY